MDILECSGRLFQSKHKMRSSALWYFSLSVYWQCHYVVNIKQKIAYMFKKIICSGIFQQCSLTSICASMLSDQKLHCLLQCSLWWHILISRQCCYWSVSMWLHMAHPGLLFLDMIEYLFLVVPMILYETNMLIVITLRGYQQWTLTPFLQQWNTDLSTPHHTRNDLPWCSLYSSVHEKVECYCYHYRHCYWCLRRFTCKPFGSISLWWPSH